MSQVLEMPEQVTPIFQDEQLNFTPSASINKRLTRYIWYSGDIVPQRRKYDFKDGDRDAGGEELPSRCLWRVRGYIRRGRITPVEVGPEWHSKEELSEQQVQTALNAGQVTMSPKGLAEFYGEDVLPGDEIAAITSPDDANSGIAKGIVELTPLIGRDWINDPVLGTDRQIFALQRLFFPKYPELPLTTRELQGLINRASGSVEGFKPENIATIASEMDDSCSNFRLWGTNFVENENQQIAARVGVGGFTYRYSDVAKVIMAQLEIEPLTISQLKEKAQEVDKEMIATVAAQAAAAVMQSARTPQVFSLDDLKTAVANNPEEFRAFFADMTPKNKVGRPRKDAEEG